MQAGCGLLSSGRTYGTCGFSAAFCGRRRCPLSFGRACRASGLSAASAGRGRRRDRQYFLFAILYGWLSMFPAWNRLRGNPLPLDGLSLGLYLMISRSICGEESMRLIWMS